MFRRGLTIRRRSLPAAALLLIGLSGTACQVDTTNAPLSGRATDQWERGYTLNPGGELQIVGGDGSVTVDAAASDAVRVVAERVAMATSDEAARQLLPRIEIREDISPERVVLQSVGLRGIVIGVKVLINYHVTVPYQTRVRVRTANGPIVLNDLRARAVVSSTNGEVTGHRLSGGLEARVVNSALTVDIASVGQDPIDLRTTNGPLDLALPADADANLSLTVTNGRIQADDMRLEPLGDQTARRVRGRLNKGGTPIELNAVNGGIRVHPRP